MANRRVRVMWSDVNGLAHGRYIPERRLHDHGHHAVTTLTMTPQGEILDVRGYAADVGYPDLSTTALSETRRPGWELDTDVMIGHLEFGGGSLALGPRNALQRAVEAWRAVGYEPMLGYELEFYVMNLDPEAPGGMSAISLPSHRVYGVGRGGVDTDLLFALFDAAEASELDIEGIINEFSPGQMEMNLRYGPALDAADRAFVAKELIRDVAAEHGYGATFIGRPIAEAVGSGLHVNMSLVPVGGGRNVFDDPSGEHGMSNLMRECLGGLIDHYEGLAAMSAPLINSYKRLVPGIIAGYWANWGLDNRISTFRIPGERGEATRIENRMPCGSASPYLAAAVMLNAALLGVTDGSDCGAPQVGNGDEEPNTDRHTPESLAEALDAFERDEPLCDAFGDDLVRCFTTIRRAEVAAWEASGEGWSVEEVTDWELDRYLPYY